MAWYGCQARPVPGTDATMIRPRTTLEADPVLVRLTDPRRTGTRPSPLPLRPPAGLRRTLFLKHVFDYGVATSLLVLSAPLVLACAVLVRLTSRGPAFYSQQRV